jgi:transmembrane sensor
VSGTSQGDPASDPTRREIRTRAAKWRERRDRPDWSADCQVGLDAWLAESPAHMVAYLRVDSVWERADRLNALRSPVADVENSPHSGVKPVTLVKFAVASAVLAMLSIGAAIFLQRPAQQIYATTVGGHETLSLDDGSQIELNTDTVVRVSYGARRRMVFLDKGEAYFQVTHNSARPFEVLAGEHRIVDLGTKFLVRRDESRFEVALTEGRAQLEEIGGARSSPTILAPGDVVVATANSVSARKKSVQALTKELGWRSGMLVFQNTPIADVAEELNRYNHKKLIVADPAIARLTIGATIPTNGLEAFTRVAREVFGLHVVDRGDEIVISR